MYSNEFMKFLFSYQKDETSKAEHKTREIRFKNKGNGKPEKVYVEVSYKH